MMTTSGPTTLVDGGTYTSVNGRVYLPDLYNNNGWFTKFYVRNDGTESRSVTIYYFDTSGTPTPKVSDTCILGPNQSCPIDTYELSRIPSDGTAYIDGGEAVSVVVGRWRSNVYGPYASAVYAGILAPAATVYAPLIHRNNSGWYSDIIVMNPNPSTVLVTVNFQRQNQSGDICPQSFLMYPKGSFTVHTMGISCLGTGVFGARITGSNAQPLAVVTTQWKDYTGEGTADALMDDEGIAAPATSNYFPLLMRGNSGWDSGLVLQNPGSTSNNVTVSYYSQSGAGCGSTNPTISANTIYVINPLPVTCSLPYVGSGKATGSQSLTSIVNHVYGADRDVMSHSELGGNTQAAAAPLVLRNGFDFGHDGWNSGLAIQNASASVANVTFRLYDGNGAQVYVSPSPVAINPYATYVVFPLPVYSGFIGSAWVSADQKIAVSATHATSATSAEDTAFSYSVPNR